jgi:hypothetical protein
MIGTPSLGYNRSPSSSKSLLPEQSRLRINCPRDGFATERARRLRHFTGVGKAGLLLRS